MKGSWCFLFLCPLDKKKGLGAQNPVHVNVNYTADNQSEIAVQAAVNSPGRTIPVGRIYLCRNQKSLW